LVPAGGVEVVEHDLPDPAAHVGEAEAVATADPVMIHRGDKGETVAPGHLGERPGPGAAGEEVDSGDVEASLAFLDLVAPPEKEALLAAAATAVFPLGLGGEAVDEALGKAAGLALAPGQPFAE